MLKPRYFLTMEFSCKICAKVFRFKSQVIEHEKLVHKGVRDYKYSDCDKTYRRPQSLRKHIDDIHLRFQYYCSECEKTWNSQSGFNQHTLSYHKNMTYNCEMCSDKFISTQTLKTHIRAIHLKEKFSCTLCLYQASRKGDIADHVNTFTPVFECP